MPTYKLICSLVKAENLDSTPYEDLVIIVKQQYDPKPSVTIQRYSHKGRRRVHLNLHHCIERAQLAQYCEYRDALSDMLRDRLVCGVNHKGITNRLLTEKELTFDKAPRISTKVP